MIQDILPHVYDNHYEEHVPDDDSYIMFVKGGRVLTEAKGEDSDFPLYKNLKERVKECVYLFSIDDKKYFLAKENPVREISGPECQRLHEQNQ